MKNTFSGLIEGSKDMSGRKSISSSIAWLSVCMLAAAWGGMLPFLAQQVWIFAGAFGLIASVGLDFAQRGCAERKRRQVCDRVNRRVTDELSHWISRRASTDRIREALTAIAEEEADPTDQVPDERRCEPRVPVNLPVVVCPVTLDAPDEGKGRRLAIAGALKDISANGLRISHKRPIPSQRVVITIHQPHGEHICFLADLLWTNQRVGHEYASGGKLLDIVVPQAAGPAELAGVSQ